VPGKKFWAKPQTLEYGSQSLFSSLPRGIISDSSIQIGAPNWFSRASPPPPPRGWPCPIPETSTQWRDGSFIWQTECCLQPKKYEANCSSSCSLLFVALKPVSAVCSDAVSLMDSKYTNWGKAVLLTREEELRLGSMVQADLASQRRVRERSEEVGRQLMPRECAALLGVSEETLDVSLSVCPFLGSIALDGVVQRGHLVCWNLTNRQRRGLSGTSSCMCCVGGVNLRLHRNRYLCCATILDMWTHSPQLSPRPLRTFVGLGFDIFQHLRTLLITKLYLIWTNLC